MKRVISSSEIVGSFTRDGKEFEFCATGGADFEESNSQLIMELDSFVRPVNLRGKEQQLRADWLPKKEVIRESVSSEDAPELARDIFHHWVAKVRQSVPLPIHS